MEKPVATDRKEWEKAQREKRIVDIAREVFIEKGYEKTGIPAVADAAGYNKRTIYLYFKDKEELFMAVVLHCLTLLQDRLASAAEDIPDNRTGLREFAHAFFSYAQEFPDYMDLIMVYESRHFVYHKSQRTAPAQGRQADCQAVSQEISDMATAALETAVQKGILKTHLPPRALMLLLWGQLFGVIQVLRMREAHFESTFGLSQEALFDEFVQIISRALV